MNSTKTLSDWLFSPTIFPYIIKPLIVLFFIYLFFIVKSFYSYSGKRKKSRKQLKGNRIPRILSLSAVALFIGLALYQAYWHLFGFTYGPLINAMKRYSIRYPNPAHHLKRGTIYDRHGSVMAEDVLKDGIYRRRYPGGDATCHILGYDHYRFGSAGLEKLMKSYLAGRTLRSLKEIRSFFRNAFKHDAMQGNDLHLTLDLELQKKSHQLMDGRSGAAVLLKIPEGDILVLYSSPGFDPGNLSETCFKDEEKKAPFLNRAIAGIYPPGSTFKIIVAAAAMKDGFDGLINCTPQGYSPAPGAKRIRDHEYYEYKDRGEDWHGYGELSLEDALIFSSNVFFAQMGVRMGPEKLWRMSEHFLFNRSYSIGIDPEHPGFSIPVKRSHVPRLAENNLEGLALMSIGQGPVYVTPIHMALVSAAVGCRGIIPSLWLNNEHPDSLIMGKTPGETKIDELRNLMKEVVLRGTAKKMRIQGLTCAGKTGTAENPHGESHSWFIGFAPADNPLVAWSVIIERGGYGSRSALPMARELLLSAINKGYFK